MFVFMCPHACTRKYKPAHMYGRPCKKKIADFCYFCGCEIHISCHTVTRWDSIKILLEVKVIMVINDFLY